MTAGPSLDELFGYRITFPDVTARERLHRLVGLDDHRANLAKTLAVLVNPQGLKAWGETHHPSAYTLVHFTLTRPPLVILSGDVGTGKSELAETIADDVARTEDVPVTLFPLSLATRGQGRVGEMTLLLSSAFAHTVSEAQKLKAATGRPRGGIILLIDEADALAQSREASQMHHEDRAGVNALIRGIDQIGNNSLPAAVLMCTNRSSALDPAITRRAGHIFTFSRPASSERKILLSDALMPVGLTSAQIDALVESTGPTDGREYGFTFSDITQRLLPAIVLDAYPATPISPDRALEVAQSIVPSPPFQEAL